MNAVWQDITGLVTRHHLLGALNAILIVVIGIFIAKRVRKGVEKLPNLDFQQRLILQKFVYYGVTVLTVAAALNQIGFDLKVLLGAAGALTVVVGFAAQTSASNLISGLFLMIDRPFMIGQVVSIGNLRGEVIALDLLSTRIRTLDNQMVRIPNETMFKADITNLSYFPNRRFEVLVGVAYREDLEKVRTLLFEAARATPGCLSEPPPEVFVQGFGDSSVNLQLLAWSNIDQFGLVRSSVHEQVKMVLDAAGVEIPFPHRQLLLPPSMPPGAQGNRNIGI